MIPTTQTVTPGRIEASLGYEYEDLNGTPGHAEVRPFANLTYGFRDGEVGASYLNQHTDVVGFSSSNSYFTVHAKYRVYSSGDGRTAVAIGVHYYDFGSDEGSDLGDVLSLYATGSYQINRRGSDQPLGRLHVGVLGQRYSAAGDSSTFARPFLGAEVPLSSQFSVGLDYLFKHGDVAKGYTASLRYQPPNKPFAAQLGIGSLRSDTKFFAGLTYCFGK